MRRSEQLADPTNPDSFEDDGADRLPAVTAARPSPPPMIPTLPRKLDATPHSKLVALRYQCDTLRALVAVHDAKIRAAEHQLANAVRSIEEYENEPIRRRPEQSPGWINALASCDQARAEIRNETEASRELREDLRAADALVRRLNEFERIYGVSEGDAGRTVLVKLLIGTLKSNGRTYRPGESFQLDEPTALGLASRRVVEIMGA